MLYPDIGHEYYPEFSQYNVLLSGTNVRVPFYIIHITNHVKVEAPTETFIEYTIVTEREARFVVARRYSDFDWLMKYLYKMYPLYILPPMPPKRIFSTTNKFNRHFVNQRQEDLERMLKRLCHFQTCLEDPFVQAFLRLHQKDFNLFRKNHKGASFLEELQCSILQIYNDKMISIKGEDVCDCKDGSTLLCFEIIHKRMSEKGTLLAMSSTLDHMALKRDILSFCLLWNAQNIADIVLLSNHSEISVILDKLAQFFFNWSTEVRVQFDRLNKNLTPIIKDYISYDSHVIDIVRNRNKSKIVLSSKKKEIFTLEAKINPENYNDLPKGNRYDQLMTESIILEDQLTEFDRIFFPSYSNWQDQRSYDIATCFNHVVETNLIYHRSCLELCKNLLDAIVNDT